MCFVARRLSVKSVTSYLKKLLPNIALRNIFENTVLNILLKITLVAMESMEMPLVAMATMEIPLVAMVIMDIPFVAMATIEIPLFPMVTVEVTGYHGKHKCDWFPSMEVPGCHGNYGEARREKL